MAYQALARKWRPRKFSEIVGQDHVVRALTHALEFDRMHHAYLFTGTRGVGKTSVARILAKALNCTARKGFDPCGTCPICLELDEGRFVDLIEVDAASRTKVEDTRDLLENVQYAPSRGRFKVYLIDEVHMLSGHSFNALLKTLEEPPPHVKFLLATTDPQKIPVTVLSRCLQFNLKRLTPEQIRPQMEAILRSEAIEFEPSAIKSLSRAADGSMRDGLSLLDQAIVHGAGRLSEAEVTAMLGTVAREPVFGLLEAIDAGNAMELFRQVEALAQHAPDFGDILQQVLMILHHAALAQWVPEAVRDESDGEQILELARKISAEDLQLFYQTALTGQRDLPLAPDPRGGFEMVLLRMLAFRPAHHAQPGHIPQAPAKPAAAPGPRPASAPVTHKPVEATPATPTPAAVRPPPVAPPPQPEHRPDSPHTEASPEPAAIPQTVDWPQIIQGAGLVAMTRELAQNCILERLDETACVLALDPQHGHLRIPRVESNLEKGLQAYFGRPIKVAIRLEAPSAETPALQAQRRSEERQRAAEIEIEQDENVQALRERFEARIVPGSIKPIDQ